ncbi:MAG TPA: methylmalonyl-CoA mutase family protein [Planctomycetota bacterium]|jgi:methylmalonyl-CoA mutase N-terminal domain/subunit|nr:methylmalonyl-CoA mutase family protein [Planctomycetota bacterium]
MADENDRLRGLRASWEHRAKGAPPRPDAKEFTTLSGDSIDLLYDPTNSPPPDYLRDLGFPGEFPFTRGPYPNMYRGRLWTMRQFSGFGTAADTNRRYRFLLEHGQTGLSVAFDFPTLMGYDPDHARARGEVGLCGVAISSLADMETLFEDIPLERISTSMTINGPAPVVWAFYLACAEKQGVPIAKVRGTIQNDCLKEFQAQHAWLVPIEPALKLIVDTFEFAVLQAPKFNPISISGYHIREAGSTALQELAFTLANGFEYVRRGVARGLDVNAFAPRLSFFFNAHIDLFEEIAKYRAARRLWARRLKEEFGATRPESLRLRFHTQTAGVSLMAQQPENNIVRTAYEALAAVLGGTQSLHTNSMDETYALPTEKAVKIALRTQQILAYETEVPHTIDPLAGSYAVEALTHRMERGAERAFREIEERGGVTKATEEGYFQREIHLAAARYQKAVEEGRKTIVGVNRFVEEEEVDIPLLRVGPEVELEQVKRVKRLRATRNKGKARAALNGVRGACRAGENLMPRFLEAAHAYATLGEICDVLREEFGEYREPKVF